MYSKNNNGPRTLPCGTPDTTSILELNTPSSLTLWVRLDKKFWKTFKIKPPTLASRNLNTRPPWLTLSNSELKSIWTSASSPPLSNSNWPAQTMSRRASQVPNIFLYDYWWEGMQGPQISPKNDQNTKRSTFQKPSTELVLSKSADSCRQAPIRYLWELESHLQSATIAETHHHATIYERDNSVLEQEQKQSSERT